MELEPSAQREMSEGRSSIRTGTRNRTEKQDVRRLIRQTRKIWGYGHDMYKGKGMTLESKKNRYDIFSLLCRNCVTLGKLFNFSEAVCYLVDKDLIY